MARKCRIRISIERYLLHLAIRKRQRKRKKVLFDSIKHEPQRAIRRDYEMQKNE